MKFKIVKKNSWGDILYWTEPVGLFDRLFHMYIILPFDLLSTKMTWCAWDCFNTLKEAEEHIRKWNSGGYEKENIESNEVVVGYYGK